MDIPVIICYCRPGVMAECVASCHSDQRRCKFYEKAQFHERCMNLDTSLNNHCWSPEALDLAKEVIK